MKILSLAAVGGTRIGEVAAGQVVRFLEASLAFLRLALASHPLTQVRRPLTGVETSSVLPTIESLLCFTVLYEAVDSFNGTLSFQALVLLAPWAPWVTWVTWVT